MAQEHQKQNCLPYTSVTRLIWKGYTRASNLNCAATIDVDLMKRSCE